MRKFNTSGVNIIQKHYTLLRENIIKSGLDLVQDERYFTIWARGRLVKALILHYSRKN